MHAPSSDPTRDRILAGAERLVRETPSEFTVERVAEAAEVSRATVYRRFPSAEALLEAVESECGVPDARERVDPRRRILAAAHRSFVGSGVAGTTMTGVAERARVSVAALYTHFPDKEALLTALLAEVGPVSLLPGVNRLSGDPEAALRHFVVGALRIGRAQGDTLRLLMAPDPVTRRAFDRLRTGADGLQPGLAPILRKIGLGRHVSPDEAVVTLMGMIFSHGIFIPMMTDRPIDDPEAVADRILSVFLDGVRAEKRNTERPVP